MFMESVMSKSYIQRRKHYKKFFGNPTCCLAAAAGPGPDAKLTGLLLYSFPPTKERAKWALVTSGMSERRQPGREALGQPAKTELMLYCEEPEGWMYDLLRSLAEYPASSNGFLDYNSIVIRFAELIPDKPSLLTAAYFAYPNEDDKLIHMKTGNDVADMLLVLPIMEAEIKYGEKHGTRSLMERFMEKHPSLSADDGRPCVVPAMRRSKKECGNDSRHESRRQN
jgi:hypothetical protein